MRLSRKTLACIGAVTGFCISGALFYALRSQSHAPARNVYNTESQNKAEAVTRGPKDYSQVPRLGHPLPGDLGRPILAAQANGQMVPVPSMGSQAHQRAMQIRDAARTSGLFLGASTEKISSAANAPMMSLPIPSLQETANADGPSSQPAATSQTAKRSFLSENTRRSTVSGERLQAPPSPYILQAGSLIPAALITGIRSDLPGQITAQVTQNVYDSPTGKLLLIPQGARLIGDYDSEVSAGQKRVLLAWDRLILPGGRSIQLDRQPGADAAGMAGLQDHTDYHWATKLKATLVSTLLGVGTQLATDSDNDLMQALRYGTQDTINQTGRQLVQREINVPPTLTIRPGHPLRVIVTRDIILEQASQETPP
jgi:type IV secretion system protein VirB10